MFLLLELKNNWFTHLIEATKSNWEVFTSLWLDLLRIWLLSSSVKRDIVLSLSGTLRGYSQIGSTNISSFRMWFLILICHNTFHINHSVRLFLSCHQYFKLFSLNVSISSCVFPSSRRSLYQWSSESCWWTQALCWWALICPRRWSFLDRLQMGEFWAPNSWRRKFRHLIIKELLQNGPDLKSVVSLVLNFTHRIKTENEPIAYQRHSSSYWYSDKLK